MIINASPPTQADKREIRHLNKFSFFAYSEFLKNCLHGNFLGRCLIYITIYRDDKSMSWKRGIPAAIVLIHMSHRPRKCRCSQFFTKISEYSILIWIFKEEIRLFLFSEKSAKDTISVDSSCYHFTQLVEHCFSAL